ncbi:MAG: membrane protein insertion efficiency factor YidD [Silvibacterium sp.]|nr:membrane protein insertion efficiency factor YidD [Silvibacterium sp.]MBV8438764.1 membrane protein insertion efficiency factor YidD [Silvibacterium sp.]
MRPRARLLSVLLGAYKYALSPFLHAASGAAGACRFQPTCSEYAAIAVSEYGIARGGWMAIHRLLRCHPFCRGGFDPVPANLSHHVTSSIAGSRHSDARTRLP